MRRGWRSRWPVAWRVTIIIAQAGQAQYQTAFDAGVRWK